VNIKTDDLIGNILQCKFYACCNTLLWGRRPKRRCTRRLPLRRDYAIFGATGAKTSLLVTA